MDTPVQPARCLGLPFPVSRLPSSSGSGRIVHGRRAVALITLHCLWISVLAVRRRSSCNDSLRQPSLVPMQAIRGQAQPRGALGKRWCRGGELCWAGGPHVRRACAGVSCARAAAPPCQTSGETLAWGAGSGGCAGSGEADGAAALPLVPGALLAGFCSAYCRRLKSLLLRLA